MLRALVAIALLVTAACGRVSDAAAFYDAASDALLRGTLDEAERLAARGLAVAGNDDSHAPALRLLSAEILLVERDVAGASRLLDAPLPAGPDSSHFAARRDYLIGYRQMVEAEFSKAAATLAAVVDSATRAGATDVAIDAGTLAGQALFRAGRWTEAEGHLARARALAKSTGDLRREAAALVTLGTGQLVRDRFDQALTYFDQVLAFTGLENYMVYATALSNAGTCHARLGQFDRALDLQRRAIALHESRDIPLYLEQALGQLGQTEFLRGDAQAALTLLARARSVATTAGLTTDAALWIDSSATALVDLKRWDEASQLNEESIRLKQGLEGSSTTPNMVTRAQIAAGRGEYDRALTGFGAALDDDNAPTWVLWQAHAGMALAFMDSGNVPRALAEFERALEVVDTARSSLLGPEYRISFLARLIHFYRAYVDALIATGRTTEALAIADASRARVLAERFGVAPGARGTAASFMRGARRADAAIVSYWLAPDRSFAWVVTGTDVHMTELPGSAAIDALVHDHRTFIEQAIGDPRRTSRAPGDGLAAAVLAPILTFIPSHARVVIVPDGSLHGVNFETLPVGDDRRYWIEDATLMVAPAVSMVGRGDGRPRSPSRSLLLLGDPVEFKGSPPRLQHAGAEVDAVRSAFAPAPVTERRGAAASPAAFLDAPLGSFSTIHFAAHATTSGLSPLDSAVELSPGPDGIFKLYARDIAERTLHADLVTISSCRSAGDRAYGGEGLVGLAWAFLRAGATRVIAGLWDVDDQSTSTLMAATYAGMTSGRTPAEALRAAKLDLIARGGNFAKPYYWAPFQVFTAER